MSGQLVVENLDVFYSKKKVVDRVNFNLVSKEFNALLGRNGCGKTTLLKGILGLLKTNGAILLDGELISSLGIKEKAKKISYIAQRLEITYPVSVKDLILMGLNPHLSLLEQVDKTHELKMIEIANELGIEKFLNEDFLTLSEGQKQLVMFARAIIQDTSVLLLDEPDSAMDFVVRHTILKLLKELFVHHNKMALITMHEPNFALTYCDNIFLMKDGRLVETIRVHQEDKKEIERKLRLIYGEVELIQHNSTYYMVKTSTE